MNVIEGTGNIIAKPDWESPFFGRSGGRRRKRALQSKAVVTSLNLLTEQSREVAESRRRGYEAAEATRLEIVNIKYRLDGLERSVDAIRPTMAEYAQVRDRVAFARSLGIVLWAVGKQLLAAAAVQRLPGMRLPDGHHRSDS